MITVNKANPTAAEERTSLVNASDGAGLHFDGSAGALNFTPPDFGSKFSFEFVIKADSYVDPVIKIIDFGVSGNAGRFAFGTAAATSYNLGIYDNSNWVSFGVKVLDDLKVHHLTLTVDGTAAVLYDNGNQVATATISASHNIDATNDAAIAAFYAGSANFFEGTIYRARFYNRTLSADDVRTAYERADVDYSSQYGSQTERVNNGGFDSATTNWTGVSSSIASVSGGQSGNCLQLTRVSGSTQYAYQLSTAFSTNFVAGKKYRLTAYVKSGTSGNESFALAALDFGTAIEEQTTGTTTGSWVQHELVFTATANTDAIAVYKNSATAGTMLFDTVSLVQIGAVSDYDLAFANPTQSRMVQDRAGAADGTASTSGVTQVQPVVQGNLTSLAVSSGTARTPADGAITADDVLVNTDTHFTTGGTPKVSINTTANALSFGFSDEIAYIRKHGSGAIFQWQTSDSGSNAGEIQLQPYGGDLLVGAADLNANVGAKKLQLEGSASTAVGPEMLLHNPAQGGGAASLLTFGGKASGTEGYTAAIKATNTGTLTIGTSSASGGFSEPAADLTIASDGNIEQHTDSNGIVKFGVKNESTGTAARAMVNVLSDSGNLDLSMNGSNYTGVTGWADSGTISTGSGASGGLKLNAVAGGLALQTNQTTRLSIANSTGLATFSGGIAFSQTNTSATGATATGTTLSHFEEGSWTPAFSVGAISGSNITYTGRYTRIGKLVYIYCKISATANDLVIGNYVGLSGLPFTAAASASGFSTTEDIDLDLGGEVNIGSTTIFFGATGSATSTQTITATLTYEV